MKNAVSEAWTRAFLLSVGLWAMLGGLPPAQGVVLYWDANGAGSGTGGSGPWDFTTNAWRSGGTTGTLQAWANPDLAYLGGTAGALTLTENIVVGNASTHIGVGTSGYIINNVEGSTTSGKSLTFDATGQTGNYTIGLNPSAYNLTIDAPVVLTGNTIGIRAGGTGGTVTFNGNISGDRGLNTHRSGGTAHSWTLVLNGSNSFTGLAGDTQFHGGVYHSEGTLVVGSDTALGTGNLYWVSGAKLQAGNGNRTVANTLRFPNDPNVEFTGTNSLTLTTAVPYFGNAKFTVTDPAATLTFGSLTESVHYTTGTFEKLGAGTLAISGNFGCGGAITVTAGTLLLNGNTFDTTSSGTQGQQNYSVAAGAAIGGDGTISLLSTSTLTLANGAKFFFDPLATLTVNGGAVDLGNLSIANILNLDNSTTPGAYTLIDGTATFDFTGVQNLGAANQVALGPATFAYFQQGSLQLIVATIPEPATIFLLACGGWVLLHVARRRGAKG